MCRAEIEDWLRHTIVELQEGLSSEQVVASASLFQDLGFDSLAFERLVAQVETTALSRDLSPWYFQAARHGEDTVGSLIDFLLAQSPDGAR
jgi:acyl carrier protein